MWQVAVREWMPVFRNGKPFAETEGLKTGRAYALFTAEWL